MPSITPITAENASSITSTNTSTNGSTCIVLVINLKRSTDRRKHMEAAMQQAGIQAYRFIEAVDGQTLPASTHIDACTKRPLSKGELGCALSNLKCYEALVNSTASSALILEDDTLLHKDLPTIMASIDRFPKDWTLIHASIEVAKPGIVSKLNHPRHVWGTYHIGVATRKHISSFGYFISKHKAQQLLQSMPPFHAPIDNLLFNPPLQWGLYNFYCLRPAVIGLRAVESTITDRKKTSIPKALRLYLAIKYRIYNLTLYPLRCLLPMQKPY